MNKQFLKGAIEKTGENSYRVIASTNAIDRQGDSVDQAGWQTDNYMKNPVMLWAHDYSSLPVAKVLQLDQTDPTKLIASYEFASEEMNPMAPQIKALVDGGFLNAVSVGFIAKERAGNVITKSELLEISFVPVPANQEALRLSYKSMGVSDEIMEELEKGAVADELNAEEVWEAKWEKWNEVSEVMSALWTVFFDEETSIDDFSKLLLESVSLLQTVAGDDGADDDEKSVIASKLLAARTPELKAKFMGELLAKEGRTLSKKTLKSIDAALDSAKTLTTVLEDIKASSTDGDGEEVSETTETVVEEVAEETEEISTDALMLARSVLRGVDRNVEASLRAVNLLLEKKGKA